MQPPRVPLAAIPASGNSGEDDEAEALAFVNAGRPGGVASKRPATGTQPATGGGNKKKPAAGTKEPGSTESESEEDESEEDEVDSGEEEDDGAAAARAAAASTQASLRNNNRGRMYVDEDYVDFPPSRSPAIFAVVQGRFPVPQQNRQQPQVFSSAVPGNPFQRYVVRVTQSNKQRPSGGPGPSLYYRPYETPKKRVVPVASFDVSVEDTRPDSDEESISVSGPTPVTSFPFVYKVQGSIQRPVGRPYRPSYYGSSNSRPRPFGPSGPGPYGRPPPYYSGGPSFNPYAAILGQSSSFGPPRPPASISSGGPPVIVRRKQSGPGPNRPPKPHLIAVYNPTGSSSGGPRPREPVEEEYYTFEVPETNNKFVPGGSGPPGPANKRPTVHRRPTPVIKQKVNSEDEEVSEEEDLVPPSGPIPHPLHIIPQGTVRRIRGGKQLKPKKNPKKTTSSTKKQQTEDPLGLLSKINKSTKSKIH